VGLEAMKEKRYLDRDTLEENGITYNDIVSIAAKNDLVKISPQASIVTQGLLDFKRILSQSNYVSNFCVG
jgi:hypothetical protein